MIEKIDIKHHAPCSVPDYIFFTLKNAILNGDLVPEEPLQHEKLQKKFDAGRSSVREALLKLEELKLVERVANKFTRVASLASNEEIADIYLIRMIIESNAINNFSIPIPIPQKNKLQNCIRNIHEAAGRGNIAEFVGNDMDFHRRICSDSVSPTLLQLWEVIAAKIQMKMAHLDRAYSHAHLKELGSAHENILTALTAGDIPKAVVLNKKHLLDYWLEIQPEMEMIFNEKVNFISQSTF